MTLLNALAALVAGLSLPSSQPARAGAVPCDKLEQSATASTADSSRWSGLYVLNRRQSDDLDAVADRVTSQMSRRMRKRAEGRLRERMEPSECLRLADDGSVITIESERGVVWRVTRDGKVEMGQGRRQGGGNAQATVTGQAIAITGGGEKGEGRYELRRTPDGTRLDLAVSLTAQRLSQPIAYRLVYDRPSQAGGSW